MAQTLDLIYKKYLKNEIDKNFFIEYLISFIENSEYNDVRIQSIKLLREVDVHDNRIFSLLENLIISDESPIVRKAAIKFMFLKFQENCFSIIRWAINHEKDYYCYTTIIKSLARIKTNQSKLLLIDEINKIKKKKYLFDEKKTTNRAFRKDLKNILKSKSFQDLSIETLAEIIINFRTITNLKQKFYSVYYELEDAIITTLDLSDVEFEVRGWKSEFKNEISKISEITGLKNLKKLKKLYLSNNQISDIKELITLKELTHLYICKNRLNDPNNIEYIKRMSNLKFLDISENGIADKINKKEFDFVIILKRLGTFFI
ncbi:MAG: leucine-rich repeat domain-containing protein [Promethearchaeota archaeon]